MQASQHVSFARRVVPVHGGRQARRDRRVIGDRHAAAVGVQWFQQLKTEEPRVTERPNRTPAPFGAQRMRAVFDHGKSMPPCDSHDPLDVTRKSVEMRRDDRTGARGNRAFKRARVEREQTRVDIREYGFQPGDPRELRNDPECQRREDDLGSLRKLQRFEQVIEGHSAVGCGHGVVGPHPLRESPFEFRDVRAFDELSCRANGSNGLFSIWDDTGAVSGNGLQHVTAFAMMARSWRSCRASTPESNRSAARSPRPRKRRKFARYVGRT